MLRSTFLLVAFALGCSSSTNDAPQTVTDSGAIADTRTSADTGVRAEIGPDSCESDLPSDYACPDFKTATPSTKCTEAALEDFVAKCIKSNYSVPSTCAAWKAANANCNTCIADWSWDTGKVYPADSKCYETLSAGCGKAIICDYDCDDTVCQECGLGSSELDECTATASESGGRCYAIASQKAQACRADTKNAVCFISQYQVKTPNETKLKGEVLRVLRGACRDNGDWTNADSAGGDAGTSDSGASD